MYIKITSRCNMHCDHCCFSCTTNGEDMSLDTFRNALNFYALKYTKANLTIGGGEPTLHKCFHSIILRAVNLKIFDSEKNLKIPDIVTNGSIPEQAFYLLNLARQKKLIVALSLDKYHDPIAPEVEKAFKLAEKHSDFIQIKNVESHQVVGVGRAAKWAIPPSYCLYNGPTIEPNGDIRYCGCENAFIVGNVNTGLRNEEMYIICKREAACGRKLEKWKRHQLEKISQSYVNVV